MCGIFCTIGTNQIKKILLQGLHSLEYRGYDSAGIAFVDKNSGIRAIKSIGKVLNLERKCLNSNLDGSVAIGHSRWATHGKVSLENTHPIHDNDIALVHNGIIENFREIKDWLLNLGYKFQSQTDTEVALHLMRYHLNRGLSMLTAITKVMEAVVGNFTFCIINKNFPENIFCAKRGSPLMVAEHDHNKFIASDVNTLSLFREHYYPLEDNDIAIISKSTPIIIWNNGTQKEMTLRKIDKTSTTNNLLHFSSYMEKEIEEQPQILSNILESVMQKPWQQEMQSINWTKFQHITIVACGSSYNAAILAKYWFESIALINVDVEFSSEFRGRNIIFSQRTLYLFISQSGETLDTLVAIKKAQKNKVKSFALTNAAESPIADAADHMLLLGAGIERSVAATKTFTAQLFHLLHMAFYVARGKDLISYLKYKNLLVDWAIYNHSLVKTLKNREGLVKIAGALIKAKNIIFIGRQELYPLALEGALKLRELSYLAVHAYAAGELKHGPISLIDSNSIVVALVSGNDTLLKILANIEEVKTRGARVVIITDTDLSKYDFDYVYHIPLSSQRHGYYKPIAFVIPLQIIAYEAASQLNLNIDRPRNLAKSVTVE